MTKTKKGLIVHSIKTNDIILEKIIPNEADLIDLYSYSYSLYTHVHIIDATKISNYLGFGIEIWNLGLGVWHLRKKFEIWNLAFGI